MYKFFGKKSQIEYKWSLRNFKLALHDGFVDLSLGKYTKVPVCIQQLKVRIGEGEPNY